MARDRTGGIAHQINHHHIRHDRCAQPAIDERREVIVRGDMKRQLRTVEAEIRFAGDESEVQHRPAIFGVVNTVYFRPLPFDAENRLMRVQEFSVAPDGARRRVGALGAAQRLTAPTGALTGPSISDTVIPEAKISGIPYIAHVQV